MDKHEPGPARKIRRRFTLSVRSLMLAVLLVGGGLGWWIHRTLAQRRVIASIERIGGYFEYDFQYPHSKRLHTKASRPLSWLLKHDLVDFFHDVAGASFIAPTTSDSDDFRPPPLAPGEREILWSNLEALGGLRSLYFQSHRMTNIDIAHLERLTRLEELWLEDSDIGDAGLNRLGGLTELHSLSVLSNGDEESPVTNLGIAHLARLKHLEALELSCSEVTDAGLIPLGQMQQLRSLRLDRTKVTGRGLVHLKGLTELRVLALRETYDSDAELSLTDTGLASLSGLVQLRMLEVTAPGPGNDITDHGLASLKGLAQLQQLSLQGSKVTDLGLKFLQPLTNLEKLNLSDTAIGDAGLIHLRALPRLRELEIAGTKASQEGIADLKQWLPGLTIHSGP
jgi:hypothetical protein